MKIGPEILSVRFILKKETMGWKSLAILNFRVTRPKFTKFLHDVTRSLQIKILNQNGNIAIRFGMPRRRMIMSRLSLSILTLKLVVMATSLEPSEEEDRMGNLRSNIYHMAQMW